MRIEIKECLDINGRLSFSRWFNTLDTIAAAKINTALNRLEQGNFSNVKGVGDGVFEYRLDFGPGYRIYLGKDGDVLVILLGGGTKQRQQRDIDASKALWKFYKHKKLSSKFSKSTL